MTVISQLPPNTCAVKMCEVMKPSERNAVSNELRRASVPSERSSALKATVRD